jgi:hypothetical protein
MRSASRTWKVFLATPCTSRARGRYFWRHPALLAHVEGISGDTPDESQAERLDVAADPARSGL